MKLVFFSSYKDRREFYLLNIELNYLDVDLDTTNELIYMFYDFYIRTPAQRNCFTFRCIHVNVSTFSKVENMTLSIKH